MGEAIQKSEVVSHLAAAKPKIQARLPKGIDQERFFLAITTVCQKNPQLMNCAPASVLLAAYEAAELGINLSPALGLGYLIPYGGAAQFQIGWRGLVQKIYETGAVKAFYAEVVYENDQFEIQFAPKRNLFHAPPKDGGDRGEKKGSYALVEFKDGHIDFEYLTEAQIERHRKHSKQADSMMWTKFWEEGWRKTPIRKLFKRLPLIDAGLMNLAEAVAKDAEADSAQPAGRIELEADSAVAKPTLVETPTPQPQQANGNAVKILIDKEFTYVNGDVRGVYTKLPSLGAKLDKNTKIWKMPAANTAELTAMLDDRQIPWVEIDPEGKPMSDASEPVDDEPLWATQETQS